jgi:hypothetical protein
MRSRYYRCRRSAALAVSVGAATAITALAGAGPAAASVKCIESPVFGSGSSFQNTAQGVFKAGWATHTSCEKAVPTSTYTATASGEGLEVFGFGGAKGAKEVLQPSKDPFATEQEGKTCVAVDTAGKCLDLFVGSDDAPTTEQLKWGTTATGGLSNSLAGEKGHRGDVVIPVAEGPVAAMLSLPAGCRILSASKVNLTNEAWNQLFRGKAAIKAQGGFTEGTWGALLTQLGYSKVAKESELAANKFTEVAFTEKLTRFTSVPAEYEKVTVHSKTEIENNENPGGKTETVEKQKKAEVSSEGCTQPIKAQVRISESGTSYATKAYFNQIDSTTWKSFVSDAATWPEEEAGTHIIKENLSTSGNETIPNKKGSQLAENSQATPGSTGYADTADAAKGGGSTGEATLSQRSSPATATLKEVAEEGEAENKTTKGKEKILTLVAKPVKSISHQILYAQVQNNGTKPAGAAFVSPLLAGKTTANCETTNLVAGDENFPKNWNESWFGTITSDPESSKVGSATDYPACALTFDVAQHHYRNTNLYGHTGSGKTSTPTELAERMANTAKDYFEYVTGQGKEDLLNNGYYTGPPSAMKGYIKAAVANIKS